MHQQYKKDKQLKENYALYIVNIQKHLKFNSTIKYAICIKWENFA